MRHYIAKMINWSVYFIAVVLLCASCTNPIKDYYIDKGKESGSDRTVVEYLDENPDYSAFMELLRQTELIDLLAKENLTTVWVPTNSTMPGEIASMSLEQRGLLVKNHISNVILYSRNFPRLQRVKTMADKYLNLTCSSSGSYIIGEDAELVNYDKVCSNGIVHEVTEWLTPQQNLYQWLEGLSDDYSMFRDSLLSRNILRFDRENSEIIGVDDDGQVIYDSVWIVSNEIFAKADIAEENRRFTFFVPDNNACKAMFADMGTYLEGVNYPIEAEDTAKWMNWLLKAAIHTGELDFAPDKSFRSVHNMELRTNYQTAGEMNKLSNGRAYMMSRCYVPRNIYVSNTTFNPYYIRYTATSITADNNGLDKFSDIGHVISKADTPVKSIFFQFTVSNPFYWFTTCDFNADDGLYKVNVMPGNYNIRCRLRNYSDVGIASQSDSIHLYVNDVLITKVTGIVSNKYDLENGGVIAEDVYIGGNYEPAIVKVIVPEPIGIETKREHMRLGIGVITLTPTDNY